MYVCTKVQCKSLKGSGVKPSTRLCSTTKRETHLQHTKRNWGVVAWLTVTVEYIKSLTKLAKFRTVFAASFASPQRKGILRVRGELLTRNGSVIEYRNVIRVEMNRMLS